MFGLVAPNLGPLDKPLRSIRRQLPPVNFITVHYAYFIFTCLGSALVFWGSSTPFGRVSFTDSLFLTVSAMTEAGLNTVNLSELNTFQQFLLFMLIMLGSAIWVSGFVVQVRKSAFEKKFADVVAAQRKERARGRSASSKKGFSLSRRTTFVEDEARGQTSNNSSQDEKRDHAAGQEQDDQNAGEAAGGERDLTPPARRGAPEMNGISSRTGQRDEAAVDLDDEDEPATSPARAGITFRGDTRFSTSHDLPPSQPATRRRRGSFLAMQGVGARPMSGLRSSGPSIANPNTPASAPPQAEDTSKYFPSLNGWIARNSQFHGLTEHERDRLGGYEYKAIRYLSWVVPLYFVLWQLLGCLGLAAYVARNRADTARANGLNPWWVGAFNAVSAFNNSGMSLLDANMTAFQTSIYMLITMSLLILAGNTAFPVFLRLIVWSMLKLMPEHGPWIERRVTLRFLLDHPRRCYTNLFPSQHTWWLLSSLVALNGIDWAAFEILNIGNSQLDQGLPVNYRVIDGLFQAFAVRSGGFYVVAIPSLRISLQVLYVVMMYISVYPVVITMRNSNVYEERSLGIYAEEEEDSSDGSTTKDKPKDKPSGPGFLQRSLTHFVAGGAPRESNSHFVRQQLRAQLAHDAWWIVLALFLIMIIEGSQFEANPATFSVFNFIFEIVSAYGCVGISVGLPYAAYSFCGSWHVLSKLILCLVMLRGRHRGLPVAIDKAVLLPGEEKDAAEEEDGRIRMDRMDRTFSRGRSVVGREGWSEPTMSGARSFVGREGWSEAV